MSMRAESLKQRMAEQPADPWDFDEMEMRYHAGDQTSAAMGERWDTETHDGFDHLTALDQSGDSGVRNWSEISLGDLCDDIVASYHDPLRTELPRIGMLLYHVAEGHAEKHPELGRVLELYSLFSGDLKLHMSGEEDHVFPLIKELESNRDSAPEDLAQICVNLEIEHESAVRALDDMRDLTHDFGAPADACVTYRAVLDALQRLEQTLREHFGIENNILFPRACQMQFAAA